MTSFPLRPSVLTWDVQRQGNITAIPPYHITTSQYKKLAVITAILIYHILPLKVIEPEEGEGQDFD